MHSTRSRCPSHEKSCGGEETTPEVLWGVYGAWFWRGDGRDEHALCVIKSRELTALVANQKLRPCKKLLADVAPLESLSITGDPLKYFIGCNDWLVGFAVDEDKKKKIR